jgi:hypothetical protein
VVQEDAPELGGTLLLAINRGYKVIFEFGEKRSSDSSVSKPAPLVLSANDLPIPLEAVKPRRIVQSACTRWARQGVRMEARSVTVMHTSQNGLDIMPQSKHWPFKDSVVWTLNSNIHGSDHPRRG